MLPRQVVLPVSASVLVSFSPPPADQREEAILFARVICTESVRRIEPKRGHVNQKKVDDYTFPNVIAFVALKGPGKCACVSEFIVVT